MAEGVGKDWLRGNVVAVTTSFGEEVRGEVYAVDEVTSTLTLRLPCSTRSTDPTVFDYRVLKQSFIASCEFVSGPDPSKPMPEPSYVNIDDLNRRQQRAIRTAHENIQRIGVGVSSEAQQIFNSMAKTLQCIWDGDVIVVGGGVRISSPYNPVDCALVGNQPRGQQALDQVRRVLAGEKQKLAA